MKYARIIVMALLATASPSNFGRCILRLSIFAVSVGTLSDCSEKVGFDAAQFVTPSPSEWQQFEKMHIVFGHQSVGANLIAGVKLLAAERGVTLSIADTPIADKPVLIRQFYIGSNGNPQSKLDAFDIALANGAAQGTDVAEMKFCFADFPDSVDPKQLAQTYLKHIETLSARYPDIIFLATTSPLTTIQTGPKAWIKRAMGKLPGGYVENMRRYEFNQILRDHYGNSAHLFDLAQIESKPGHTGFQYGAQSFEALAPEISDDGGHLNIRGQRMVASAWIRQLAGLKPHD